MPAPDEDMFALPTREVIPGCHPWTAVDGLMYGSYLICMEAGRRRQPAVGSLAQMPMTKIESGNTSSPAHF